MSTSVSITTTQNVQIEYETASIGDRALACLIDVCILYAYAYLIDKLYYFDIRQVSKALLVALNFLPILYFLAFEVFNNGRSVGKMVMQTRVVRLDGTEPRLSDFIIRWLIGLLEIVGSGGGLALIFYLVIGRGQRLGDVAAGTTVAKLKKRVTLEQTLFEEIAPGDYNVSYPGLAEFSDSDMETIKEVVTEAEKDYNVETILLVETAKHKLESRMGIKANEPDALEFLKKVLKDFNYLTGR